MRDFFYRLEPGKAPAMEDHLNTLDIYCWSPINLSLGILYEAIDLSRYSELESDQINDCLNTIQAALISWRQIDEAMLKDSSKGVIAT